MMTNENGGNSLTKRLVGATKTEREIVSVAAVPTGIGFGVKVKNEIVCYTETRDKADYLMHCIEAAETFAAIAISALIDEACDGEKKEEA